MILVDVFVPAIDQVYNFSLDENARVGAIVAELIEMVEQREQTSFVGKRDAVTLIDKGSERALPKEATLRDCRVVTGSTLLLI